MQRSTIGAVLRSNQAYYQQIAQRETLDHGIAYYNDAYPTLPEVNQIREVVIQTPAEIPVAFEAAEAFYQRHRLKCLAWTPAEGTEMAGLGDFLRDKGFVERTYDIMTLVRWVDIDRSGAARVVPARAVRTAFRATFGPSEDADAQLRADAAQERLDDPQMDMVVAMIDGQPAGRCGLYQVGDIGRVIDLSVLPTFEESDVHKSLLAFAIALGKRLALPIICTQVPRADAHLRRAYEAVGFLTDGIITEYHRPPDRR